jgi:RHS repeat-associated protein
MNIRTNVSGPRCHAAPLRWALPLWLALSVAAAWAQSPPAAATTTYAYDEAGNKTRQTDALSRTTRWTYDALDRVASRQLPDGTEERNSYDAAGNLVAKTNFAGEHLAFQYDAMDRLSGQVIPAGAGSNQGVPAGSALFRYTATGMLAARSEQGPTTLAGEQSFRYDAMDRLVEVKGPTGQINYGRDAAGNVIQRSVAGAGTAHYEYDAAGRMTRVVASDGKQTLYGYDAAGRLDRVERQLNAHDGQAQALITSYAYDSADRVILIGHLRQRGNALSLIAGQRLMRAAGGTIVRIETDRGTGESGTGGQVTGRIDAIQDFEYDALGRLTREDRTTTATGNVDTGYEYDVVGNRTRKTVVTPAGTEITTYTYDLADRLTEEATTLPAGGSRSITYTWDANGNLASKTEPGKVTLYRFDPLNRLIDIRQGTTAQLAEAAQALVRYAYDAEGNRVRKWKGTEQRKYTVDQEELFAQVLREQGATESIDYLRGLGLIRETRIAATTTDDSFPLPGHLGTNLGGVNARGEITEEVIVDAFGGITGAVASQQAHLFAGEYWDPDTELLYLRARWYAPSLGRFVSADPHEGRQREPRSLNRYAYAQSDPVHGTDPSGRELNLGAIGQGLATMGRSLAVRTTMFAWKHPNLTGIAGFLTSIFLPMELGPGSNVAASLGTASSFAIQSGARHMSKTAAELSRNGNFVGQGDELEKLVASILRVTKNEIPRTVTLMDGRAVKVVPDFYWGKRILETKTSGGALSRLDQAAGLARLAEETDSQLIYIFYKLPDEKTLAKLMTYILEEAGPAAAQRVQINYLFK